MQTISFAGLTEPFVETYRYDSLYRITEARETNGPATNGSQNWKETFSYDRFGNRTTFTKFTGTTQLALDNKTFPSIDPATNRFNPNQGYLYDKNGNLISDAEGRSFVFNGENKQAKIIKDGKLVGEYDYDGEGKRVRKRNYDANGNLQDTTVFVYSAGKLVAEYTTAAPPANPTTRYTATDMLGSPRVITDSEGNVISRRDFKPFGEEITSNTGERTTTAKYGISDNLRQKFTTYQRDEESGLDYAEARMYENRHGRFTAVDPLLASGKSANPQTFNRFVYVLNSPLTMSDPDGLQAGRWVFPTAGGDGKYLKNDKPIPKGYFEVTERNRNGDLVVPWSQSKSTTSGDKTYYDYVVRLNEFGPRTPQTFIDSRTGRTFKESLSFYERQGWEVIKGDGYHYVHPATGAVVNAIEPIDVALVLAPFKFGAVARGTTITRLGVAGESSTTVPYRLALGLGDVKEFARTTKSVTYIERTGTRLFIPEKFERLARNATEINFNFGARATGNQFSVSRFAVWQRNGRPLQSGTFTMQELDFILSNREIVNKTRFHVFPGN